eukprot:11138570-Alexandrium_andersonii.AAC.1
MLPAGGARCGAGAGAAWPQTAGSDRRPSVAQMVRVCRPGGPPPAEPAAGLAATRTKAGGPAA